MRKALLLTLIGMLSLSVFVACGDKDEDTKETTEKVEKDDIEDETETSKEEETTENNSVEVPDVIQKNEADAILILETSGLTYKLEFAESEAYEKGIVMSQSIEAGSIAEKGVCVTITISEGKKTPELVWKVAPSYDFNDVTALSERYPAGRIGLGGLEGIGSEYKSRYMYKSNDKEGMIDLYGNIILDASLGLSIEPRYGVIDSKYNVYDMNGNIIGMAFGGGGNSYKWNELTGKLLSADAGSLQETDTNAPHLKGDVIKAECVSVDLDKYYTEMNMIVESLGTYRLVTDKGNLIIDEKFEDIKTDESLHKEIVTEYAVVKKNGLWGYVSMDGKWLLECQYDDAYSFTSGIAAVKKDGKAGFVYEDGSVAIDFVFEETRTVNDGLAWVKYEGKWGVIDVEAMKE